MSMLQENIDWNTEQAYSFYLDAEEMSTRDRSRYYKASSIFAASVVGAMVFVIVKHCYDTDPDVFADQFFYSYQPLYRLPSHLLKNEDDAVVVYEERKKDFVWKGVIDFQALNRMGLRYNLFDKRLFNKLEKIREQRNRIHIQALQEKHHRFTRRDVEYIFAGIDDLINLLPKQ